MVRAMIFNPKVLLVIATWRSKYARRVLKRNLDRHLFPACYDGSTARQHDIFIIFLDIHGPAIENKVCSQG
jgi:hypothetical protein